ncbi:MAG: hypothetical protein P9M14_00520 [Candidatus Alcyoniella australis]|nr:hypothetical protein [Candidatus Alcyoniella australis]
MDKKLETFRKLVPENRPQRMVPAGSGLSHSLLWTLIIGVDLVALVLFGRAMGRYGLALAPSLAGTVLVGAVTPWIISMLLWGLGLYRTVWLGWNKNHLIVLDPGMLRPRVAGIILLKRDELQLEWIGRGSLMIEADGVRKKIQLDRPSRDRPLIQSEFQTP